MQPNIEQDVRNFVIETFLLGKAHLLRDDASFIDEGLIDSTGVLEIVSFIEEKYSIHVADDELIPENLDSVINLVRYVTDKMDTAPHEAAAMAHAF